MFAVWPTDIDAQERPETPETLAMSSPPLTPVHRRQSSNHSNSSRRLSQSQSYSRRSSAAYSPAHSGLGSSHGGGESLANEFAELGDGGGMGSLADELGGWSGDEEEEDMEDFEGEGEEHTNGTLERERDSGIDVSSSPSTSKHLSPTSVNQKKGHRRLSSAYDGGEYGSESDLEETELVSATLEARMASIEAMARRGLEENGTEGDKVVARVTEALRDLGWQSSIETGSTRLSTSCSALSTYLTNQSRSMTTLTQHIFSPLSLASLPLELLEELIPEIDSTLPLLASILPSTAPLYSLHALHASTADLVSALDYMKDTLQVNQQSTNQAGRMLRAAKDAVGSWRKEMNSRDDSVRWIEQGCWDQRLRQRDAQSVCDDVMKGFEEHCDEWRARLSAGLEVEAMA
ncbi:hypothetical protein E2P81_ATG05437 [Venturia nashicola]|uniref:Uncharacterized protein n=1 Tax=Venturia nashicola TaxID=86259 RepID=A0A4Z1NXX4_9PEZI|nr:hypothetical protein E6O75_ATG05572 [Venturia nashicola]TLD32461.1 hypothetical protein E2P81_ATG05437 [Venturia nashicola]